METLDVVDQENNNVVQIETQINFTQRKPLSSLDNILVWPKQPVSKNKRQKTQLPSVLTSQQWQEIQKNKIHEKEELVKQRQMKKEATLKRKEEMAKEKEKRKQDRLSKKKKKNTKKNEVASDSEESENEYDFQNEYYNTLKNLI